MTGETNGYGRAGAQLASYRLETVVGCGVFGCVHHARHVTRETVHAVKVVRPDIARRPHFAERFLQDLRTAANLSHPNIARVADFGVEHDVPYVVMDLVEGDSLAERLERLPVPLRAADRALHGWVRDIAAALDHAHARGIIHRDLKPSNVLLRAGDERAVVTDFAIARPLGDRGLADIGTPAYLAPEQRGGTAALTAAVDVYAFAAVLHEIATGEPPTPGGPLPQLDGVLERGLAAEPAARPPTAGALARAFLDAFAPRDEPVEPEPESEAEPASEPGPASEPEPAPAAEHVPEWVAAMRLEAEPWPPPRPARHRKGRLRWLIVIVLGVFVAVGFGAIAVLGLVQPAASGETPAGGTPLAAAPPPPPASGLPQPVRGTVGRPVELPGTRLTVLRVDTGAPVPARLATTAGESRFVVIEVRYENVGSGAVTVSPFDWDLIDGSGTVYQALERQVGGDLPQQDLEPGHSARGVIGFLVPRSAQRLVLTFTSETGDQAAVVPVT